MSFILDSFSPSSYDDSLSSSPMLLLKDSPRRPLGRSSSSSALPSRSMASWSSGFRDLAGFMDQVFKYGKIPAETLKQDKGNVKVNWLETPQAHVLKVDLPGMTKEDIKLNPHGERGISIRGERKNDVENEDDIWRSVEAVPGRFRRDFELPEDANVAEMKATYTDGVLTITVPKKEDPVKYVEIA